MLEIKVLGTGCAKCNKLFDETQKAIEVSGVASNLAKVEKLDEIMKYNVLMVPALVINDEVKSTGKVPKAATLVEWLQQANEEKS
jgi:small redox-active disulfide protein 2